METQSPTPLQSGIPVDADMDKINLQYERTRQDIDRLKAQLQNLRRQNSISDRTILKTEYEKFVFNEEKESNTPSTANPDSNNNDELQNTNTETTATEPVTKTNDLQSLQCSLKDTMKLQGHGNKVYCCDWNPVDHTELCSVGRDAKLIFWNTNSGYKRLAYPLDTEFIMSLKYSPSGQFIACGGLDDLLSLYPVRSDTGILNDIEPTVFKGHSGYISCIEYIDEDYILTASGDATIRKWNVNGSSTCTEPVATYNVHREDVMSISVNPSNPQLLLSGSVDSTAKIIDFRMKTSSENDERKEAVEAFNVTHSFFMGYDQDLLKRSRNTDVNVVRWFPDGVSFVAGCDDGTVRLFDSRCGRVLNKYSYHKEYLNEDSRNEFAGSVIPTSTNTNSPSQEEEMKMVTHEPLKESDEDPGYNSTEEELDLDPTDGVAALDFSRSGAFMMVSYNNDNHHVLVWNILTGEIAQELKHEGHVPSLRMSPDGARLLTACWDHNLKIWQPRRR